MKLIYLKLIEDNGNDVHLGKSAAQ